MIDVYENNLYNEYTQYSETTTGDLLARGAAFGVHAEGVDGQDVRVVYATAQRLVERARKGEGSAFLVCDTYRYHRLSEVAAGRSLGARIYGVARSGVESRAASRSRMEL